MTLILDESVTRQEELSALKSGASYILNARVSKHGGLLRTLATIRAARDRGIKVIVGAQVGRPASWRGPALSPPERRDPTSSRSRAHSERAFWYAMR
jgi:hypothetical protein